MKQIRIYNHVFRIEKTVYSIQGVALPIPVSYRQMVFFIGAVVMMLFLNRFPPICWIDYHLVKFVGVPLMVAWFFTQKTLDGKSPHRFFLRYIEYKLGPQRLARYQSIDWHSSRKYEGEVTYRVSREGSR